MATILIVYGTQEGHTAAIAERMREAIEAKGHQVRVEGATKTGPSVPEDADGVLVGASVHGGKYQDEVRRFVDRNHERLAGMPSAFFQVCLLAADPSPFPETRAETQDLIDRFVQSTGWHPGWTATFAGKLAWTQYDLFTRVLMRLIVRKHVAPEQLDTSQDVDYTDYEAARRFAEEFASSVEGGRRLAVTGTGAAS